MSGVRIADELRVLAPIGIVWHAIEDPSTHAAWHPFVDAIAGGHELHEVRSCAVRLEHGGATIVIAESTFSPNKALVRLMLPPIRRKFHRTQRAILGGLKEAVEAERTARAAAGAG